MNIQGCSIRNVRTTPKVLTFDIRGYRNQVNDLLEVFNLWLLDKEGIFKVTKKTSIIDPYTIKTIVRVSKHNKKND